ncbi:primase 1D-like protein [Pigmentiphaga litoralis]|uniref:primase 1D-like protein n=1 Tax=Pigmentiphaga litoralis TaxID=516702 RepID=UPI001676CC10|nr:hypothetical protein [Pigmentiphaga litoralis]
MFELHPYWHVRRVIQSVNGVASIPFSYYCYEPRTVADARHIFYVSKAQFADPSFIVDLMAGTPLHHELALHSDLRMTDGSVRHLSMIDMATSARAHLMKLEGFLQSAVPQPFIWFESGRSFHGYGTDLLNTQSWVKFMGLLLLANAPRFDATVDPRWIGHRLLAGYSALRWTKNTSNYVGLPRRIHTGRQSWTLFSAD